MENITLSDSDRAKLKNAVITIADAMGRVAEERDAIKEIVSETNEATDLPKKIIRKLAKTYYEDNMSDQKEETNTLESLFNSVLGESE